jgi:hypothetical protein
MNQRDLGATETTQSTKAAIKQLESLSATIREKINFFWITATGIMIDPSCWPRSVRSGE